jgi:hypothetical protein
MQDEGKEARMKKQETKETKRQTDLDKAEETGRLRYSSAEAKRKA